jgi:hypothetical protein
MGDALSPAARARTSLFCWFLGRKPQTIIATRTQPAQRAAASSLQTSNIPLVIFNFICLQEGNELVSERNLLMMLFLGRQITLDLSQI